MKPGELAEVYVGNRSKTGRTTYLSFATGFPISRDRVVTAGHVLTEKYGFIGVRFQNSNVRNGLIPATLQWDGRPDFDVAVLSCDVPKDIPAKPELRTDHPNLMVDGQGIGYARVSDAYNHPGVERKHFDLFGKLTVLGPKERHFEIQLNYDLRSNCEEWRDLPERWTGLSGAPVFLMNRIAGVVQEYLGYATAARFRVVAMCRLLQVEAFRAAIGWSEGPSKEQRLTARASLGKLLNDLGQPNPPASEVLRELARKLRSVNDPSGSPSGGALISFILDALVDRREFRAISTLSSLSEDLCEQGRWREAGILDEIVDHVTPIVIDPQLVTMVWNLIKVQKQFLFPATVDRAVVVESLMACVDGQRMSVRPPTEKLPVDDYYGKSSLRGRNPPLNAPPEAESLAKGILLDLCESHDVPDRTGASRSLSELIARFAGILLDERERSSNEDRTLYCFHAMPTDWEERKVHEEALTLIRSKLDEMGGVPALIFVVLAETSEIGTQKTVIVRVLNKRFHHQRNRPANDATRS